MSRNSLKPLVLALALMVAAGTVHAQSSPPSPNPAPSPAMERLENRQALEQSRIATGAANGSLTAQETRRLEKRQHRLDQRQARAQADGTVTRQEARKIRHATQANRHAINRKEDNARGQQP